MGSSGSRKSTYTANVDTHTDKKVDGQFKKVLLFGAHRSGKSTLFKQLRLIYGDGFSLKDRRDYKVQMEMQIITQMQKIIIRGSELLEDYGSDKYGNLEIKSDKAKQSAQFIELLRRDAEINDEIANHINILWDDPAVRNIWKLRGLLSIPDSCSHFFDNIHRICSFEYTATYFDILSVCKRTCSIIDQRFSIKNRRFHVFDLGGCRNYRKRWIHCFEHVECIIFVASLSSYNEKLVEDESVTGMLEELHLWKEICNSRWFKDSSCTFTLLLNKMDLFRQALKVTPLTVLFGDEYNGRNFSDTMEEITSQLMIKLLQLLNGDLNIDIPMDIVNAIAIYLHLDLLDEKWLNLCVDDGIQFIKQKYLSKVLDCNNQVNVHTLSLLRSENIGDIFDHCIE